MGRLNYTRPGNHFTVNWSVAVVELLSPRGPGWKRMGGLDKSMGAQGSCLLSNSPRLGCEDVVRLCVLLFRQETKGGLWEHRKGREFPYP